MKRIMFAGLVLCGLVGGMTVALAGKTQTKRVTIKDNTDGTITVTGSLHSARTSSDTKQYINCSLNLFSDPDQGADPEFLTSIQCFAQDANGRQVVCTSTGSRSGTVPTASAYANAVTAINSTSFITFKSNNTRHPTCTDITITNDSQNL
jgi:hypothetical protein